MCEILGGQWWAGSDDLDCVDVWQGGCKSYNPPFISVDTLKTNNGHWSTFSAGFRRFLSPFLGNQTIQICVEFKGFLLNGALVGLVLYCEVSGSIRSKHLSTSPWMSRLQMESYGCTAWITAICFCGGYLAHWPGLADQSKWSFLRYGRMDWIEVGWPKDKAPWSLDLSHCDLLGLFKVATYFL